MASPYRGLASSATQGITNPLPCLSICLFSRAMSAARPDVYKISPSWSRFSTGPVLFASRVSRSPPQQQRLHMSLFTPFLWQRISPGSNRALSQIIISRDSHGRLFQRLGPHCDTIERSGPDSCITSAYPKDIHPHFS